MREKDADDFVDKMPRIYEEIPLWLNKNKQTIYENPKLITRIQHILNKLSKEVSSITKFKKDMEIFAQTIKIEYDALLKEYNQNLTQEKFLNFIDKGRCVEYFLHCKENELSYNFLDILNIDVEDRIRNRTERIKEEYNKEQTNAKKDTENIETNETNLEIEKLKEMANSNRILFNDYVYDKNSFSKTVFNIFNVSLAVKMKVVSLTKNSGDLFIVPYDTNNNDIINNEHSVFELNYDKWLKHIDKN